MQLFWNKRRRRKNGNADNHNKLYCNNNFYKCTNTQIKKLFFNYAVVIFALLRAHFHSPASETPGNAAKSSDWPSEIFPNNWKHKTPNPKKIKKPKQTIFIYLFTSVLLTVRLVKSFTQSVKHSSVSLLYETRKSLNWKRVFWGYVDNELWNAYRAYLFRVQIVDSRSGWQWHAHFCVVFVKILKPEN